MSCSCFHGTPIEDANGNCTCDNGGVRSAGCDGVIIDGQCTGGIRGIVNQPVITPVDLGGEFGIFGRKSGKSLACQGMVAPNGYQYILSSLGECVLAVKYDYDTTRFSNPITNLLNGSDGSVSDFVANNKGLIGLGIAGLIAYFMFGRDKDGTATSRTVISRRGIS